MDRLAAQAEIVRSQGGPPLEAVLFDLDGTLADTERDGHRVAFNRAFETLGLPDRWDEESYGELLWITGGRDRLAHYFTHHRPLPPEERDHLAGELHAAKNRLFLDIVAEGRISARRGAGRVLRELQERGIRTAVATGGSREWVLPLLEHLFGEEVAAGFGCVVCGDDISRGKPDPEIYLHTLDRLRTPPERALAVEDAENGLRSAKAAGLACVIVPNGYTADHDFTGADLVTDGFGDRGAPCRVLANPHGVGVKGRLDAKVLEQAHGAANAGAAVRG